MTALAIPTALDVLRSQLRQHASLADIALPLRALQNRGLSKLDLVVQVERLRVQNELTVDDESVEESCLLALDLIHGDVRGQGLLWDAAHDAAALLPRSLSLEDLESACRYALEPSDLLPPRPRLGHPEIDVFQRMAVAVYESIQNFERLPTAAAFFRVPKDAFTTRPAAILTLDDQVLLEGLTKFVESDLNDRLPASVIWPRYRLQSPLGAALSKLTKTWKTKYIAKADISAFYENIDHSLLAVLLVGNLGVSVTRARAIEALLSAVMGSTKGLPQGPASSDVLASAFLLGVDLELERSGVRFKRYADDYFFPTKSVDAGRRILEMVENLIGDLGLTLNSAKTQVMRRDSYERGLRRPSPAVEQLKERITRRRITSLLNSEDSDDLVEILQEAGVDEERLWDVFYHETATLEEVLEGVRDRLGPTVHETYQIYFHRIGGMLMSGDLEAEASALASLARECLVVLMSSPDEVAADDLDAVLTWFPTLAPIVSEYVNARSDGPSANIRRVIVRRLRKPSGTDWFDAWMCRTAGAPGMIKSQIAVKALRSLLQNLDTQPLTRVEATRALARGGALNLDDWTKTLVSVSLPLKSELLLTAMASIHEYPWMSDSVAEFLDRNKGSVSGALSLNPSPAPPPTA